jgi:hypothetical protein
MLKIKKINKGDALQACSSPIIIVERVTSSLIVDPTEKSVSNTYISGGTGRLVETCLEPDDWLNTIKAWKAPVIGTVSRLRY